MKEPFIYNAKVTGVYDGDSITVTIDLGFNIKMIDTKCRLANINTPELRGEEREAGLIARDVLREKILDKDVLIRTTKDKTGKYGRYLAEIFLPITSINESDGAETLYYIDINKWLVAGGYAEPYE